MRENNFTHLHVHTEFSLLDGASKIPELIERVKELGMDSVAITDHGVMYGIVDFYQEAVKRGIKPIIGCEVYLAPGSRLDKNSREAYHLILLAENNEGYHNLMKLVSYASLDGFYYHPRIDKELLRRYSKGLICLSACISGEVPMYIRRGDIEGARRSVEEYIGIFGRENYFLELQNHGLEEERLVNAGLKELADEYGLRLVATNDSHYTKKEDAEAQDVLLCIQTGSTVESQNRMRFPNDSFYVKSRAEMQALFSDCPEALKNTGIIAERCNVHLEFGQLLLPEFPVPDGFDADSYLEHICRENMDRLYPEGGETVLRRLDYELGIIGQMGYACYFLIVWDFILYCRKNDIPVGPGRGSAAGSIVAYLLSITNIDPIRYNLLFERFLNPERVSMPDIDTDFCYLKRDQVLDYVVKRYGKERVAQIITFGTLQARAAVRDVGKALGMSYASVDEVAKLIPRELGITLERALRSSNDLRSAYELRPEVKRLIDLAKSVEGLPKNAGTHAAGVIIAPRDLKDYVPLQAVEDNTGIVTQYDKDKVESLGLLKMDFLGLRTLTVIDDAVKFIRATKGLDVNIDDIPLDDEKTCRMLSRGDTFGVFQLESAGITKLVTELAPESFEDLIPLVALYRPGPLGTGMAEDFIAGRHGRRTAEILHPLMEPILEDTYGVILYQEQVMQITSALAGFSLGQADILRRAMGKKKAKELDSMRQDFIDGAKKLHGISETLSSDIFALLQHFAGYGFNKSHSVAYALVAYQTAYLKAHWPAQYMAAFLNSVINESDKLSWYISVCRSSGIRILPPDVNVSGTAFTVDGNDAIRFGLSGVKGAGAAAVSLIIEAREKEGPFRDLSDFCRRVSMRLVNKRIVENLIRCGAMNSFGMKRSQLLAVMDQAVEMGNAYQRDAASGQIGLFDFASADSDSVELLLPDIEELPQSTVLQNEKELIGFYVTGHPLDEYKGILRRYMPLHQFRLDGGVADGKRVKAAGIITECVIKNTKRGDSMALLTLEDHSGSVQVVVFPKTYQNCSRDIYQENIVSVLGRFSIDERESKIVAGELRRLDAGPAHEVRINISPQSDNSQTQKALKRVFENYHGADVVYLHLTGSGKIIRTLPSFWVDSKAPGFYEAVEEVLGADCFL